MSSSPSSSNQQFLTDLKESEGDLTSSTTVTISSDKPDTNHNANRKSYQLRALGRKTVSYQKRQWFVNICCLSLCPFMMVAIGGILGIVVTHLIRKNAPLPAEYLMCSSVLASDKYGLPNPVTDLPSTPAADVPNSKYPREVLDLNFFLTGVGLNALNGLSSNNLQSCVFWFEHNYPFRSPYERNPNANQGIRKDTTFKPDPEGGWFGQSLLANPVVIASMQTYPWALVLDKPGVNSGQKDMRPPLGGDDSLTASRLQVNDSGLLGSVATNYFLDFSNITKVPKAIPSNDISEILQLVQDGEVPQVQQVPYFNKVSGSPSDVDTQLLDRIQSTTKLLKNLGDIPDDADKLGHYYSKLVNIYKSMPWGSIMFDQADSRAMKWDYTLQIGSDKRINNAVSTYPRRGLRNMALQTQLSTAFLKNSPKGSNATISHGFRVMPQLISTEIDIPIDSFIGGILYPFGVSFLIPIFVLILVKEKEDRILVMMRMNGLSPLAYYIAHYIHFYILHTISSIVFVISGVAFGMSIFTQTHPFVYIFLLFIWGHAQIAIAFFLSSFFGKTRTALIASFLIILCGVICNLGFEVIFNGNTPMVYYFWLPFAFYHGLHIMNMASIDPSVRPYSLVNILYPDDLAKSLIALGVGTIVYLLIASYLNAIMPSAYGVRKPWYFIFTLPFKKSRNKRKIKEELPYVPTAESKELLFEDEDVRMERERVLNDKYINHQPLVMKNMRKEYSGDKIAVKNVTFAVESNIVFGLLGPNGAGKTTLISILTGLYEPTSGQAYLGGFSVNSEMKQVYLNTGVCPQHDILWEDLTVGEHLLFYARLKGVKSFEEKSKVDEALAGVSLQKFKNRLSKGLSGGEKRRLSIAIALIGSPTVVFLDEPTTGLDPEVKRLIWDIISDAKHGRTIVLTTHSMEEAEVLCNRIGIMAHGTLRCIGPQLRLKEVYGKGFKLSYNCRADMAAEASKFVESLLPTGWKKIDKFVSSASYEFMQAPGAIPLLFEKMELCKERYGIIDWGLSQTSLEEVFLRIINEAEADAE
ncbi:hypothetical protein K493DRAFT_409054 [Basidiobolus meristosporus CBS 931.73]|uniref:ABC transporter domain-containing protein n=1 Tax=Basidiobolus meristosporus CBS 931.73 TaxID=1314790 RepID=A0A1Y1Y1S3_9FUNG|nr:hypothetical protein K493DRAFT_409054 [Basidiobolus meristosporus CBS 931.73]|eukprot:ORX91953.1 hypothetical protein K493DRAFT_409054 [Basidiobolus meristosporus CBS 931.73]